MTEFLEVNGIKVRCEIGGDPALPPVVLSNSLCTSLEMWDPQWASLCKEFRVIRYDTRGHGHTDVPEGPYSMGMLSDDVLGLLDALDVEKAHFVGLSLGGMIAQHTAIAAPERVESLCLIATTARLPGGDPRHWNERIRHIREIKSFEVLLPTILDRWVSMRYRRDCPSEFATVRQFIIDTPIEGYLGAAAAIRDYDILEKISAITVPTLVIEGEEDTSTTVEDGRDIVERIKGSELRIVPYYRHLVNWEAEDTINEWLLEWLRQCSRET